jgi:hypothetical protein
MELQATATLFFIWPSESDLEGLVSNQDLLAIAGASPLIHSQRRLFTRSSRRQRATLGEYPSVAWSTQMSEAE